MKKNTWLKWAILASSTALFVGFLQLTNDAPTSETTGNETTLLPEAPTITPPPTDEQDELYDTDDDDDDLTEDEDDDDDFRSDRRSFSSTLNREAQPSNGHSQSARS